MRPFKIVEWTMSQALSELVSLLELTQVAEDTFSGHSQDLGFRALFGGQVLGQSVSAALKTLPQGQWCTHSLHSYFLRPGTVHDELTFVVQRVRDGRSFCTRSVRAKQKDKVIFVMMASFQQPEDGFEHQSEPMPSMQGPDGVASQLELARLFKEQIPPALRDKYTQDQPIELRVIDPVNVFKPEVKEPTRYMWMKADGQLADNPDLHTSLLAYASDFNFLTTSLHPHAASYGQPDMRVATIDHSVWFHRPFKIDEWLLYAMDSPSASGARGFVRGQIYNQQGQLVASSAQEGLIRQIKEKK